jgi:hypothetical protein
MFGLIDLFNLRGWFYLPCKTRRFMKISQASYSPFSMTATKKHMCLIRAFGSLGLWLMFWIIPDFHWLNSMFGQIPSRNLDSWRFYPDLWLLYPRFFWSNQILHSWSTPCSLNIKTLNPIKSPVFDAHPPDFLLSKGCWDFSPKGHACSTPRATLWRGWWRWLCRCRLRKLNIHSHFNFWPLFNGHFRILKWRYRREYPHKIWPYMVQYLHFRIFRILEFPLTYPSLSSRSWRACSCNCSSTSTCILNS